MLVGFGNFVFADEYSDSVVVIETNIGNLGILGLIVGLQLQRAHAQIADYTWMAGGLLILLLLWNILHSYTHIPKWLIHTRIGLVLQF